MSCYISVRDIDFHSSTKGVRIIAYTDVACHLYCRLTTALPRIHKKPSYRRGIWINDDVRFCFTLFEDNEQHEEGDTLIHTWWKESWPVCTTKHFYFWGYANGQLCPSTSPLFQYHNDGVAPVTQFFLIFHEPWTYITPPPPAMHQLFLEPWDSYAPGFSQLFLEPWTS